MNTLSTLTIAASVAAGLAAPAVAASFAPKNTNFFAAGPITITTPRGSMQCTVTFQGVTTGPGEVEFINASFNGTDDNCFVNSFANTPYYVAGESTRLGKILGASGFGTLFSPCGPGALPFTVDKNGVWTLKTTTLAGSCTISGSVTTSPRITIAP